MNVKRRRGFTLVEVLIVVTIMAILAATIIPQFTSSAEDARQNQLDFNLRTLRAQVQLYQLHHNSTYPATLDLLTKKTDIDGTVNNASGKFGPYIVGGKLPDNPITGTNVETASTDGTATGGGWLYDASSGTVWADGESGL